MASFHRPSFHLQNTHSHHYRLCVFSLVMDKSLHARIRMWTLSIRNIAALMNVNLCIFQYRGIHWLISASYALSWQKLFCHNAAQFLSVTKQNKLWVLSERFQPRLHYCQNSHLASQSNINKIGCITFGATPVDVSYFNTDGTNIVIDEIIFWVARYHLYVRA